MIKQASLTLSLLLLPQNALIAMEPVPLAAPFPQEENYPYIMGRDGEELKPIAVPAVPYHLYIIDQKVKKYLAKTEQTFKLQQTKESDTHFIFQPIEGQNDVRLLTRNKMHAKKNKERCELIINNYDQEGRAIIRLKLKNTEDDTNPAYLYAEGAICGTSAENKGSWFLEPYHDLNYAFDEEDSMLFKVKKKMPLHDFTQEQIRLLLDLHKFDDPFGRVTEIHDESGEHYFLSVPDTLYREGIYIFPSQIPLTIAGLRGFKVAKAQTKTNLKDNAREAAEDILDVETNECAYIIPSKEKINGKAPRLGRIELIPSAGLSYWICGSKQPRNRGLTVGMICKTRQVIDNKYVATFLWDSIRFTDTSSPIPNAGNIAFLTHVVTERALMTASTELHKALKELTDCVNSTSEKLRDTINQVSDKWEPHIKFTIECFNNRLDQAIKTFETSLKLIVAMVGKTSEELKDTAKIMGKDLSEIAEKLREAAEQTTGAVRDTVTEAIHLINQALTGVCGTLEKISTDVKTDWKSAITQATGDFVTGMNKLKDATESIKTTKHHVSFCVIC